MVAATQEDRQYGLWVLLMSLGLRRGEALALRWPDLDLDEGVVSVSRSLQRVWAGTDPVTGKSR